MLLSANEIEQTAQKACVAAGLGHDRAADLAAAAVWLAKRGIDGVAALAPMLEAGGLEPPVGCRISGSELRCGGARPAIEGVAAIDWLVAGGRDAVVHLDAVGHPEVMLGLLGQASADRGLAFVVEPDEGGHVAVGAAAGAVAAEAMRSGFRIRLAEAPLEARAPEPGHLDIEDGAWKRLSALAFETYVPTSEASRLSGAGAGLVDND